MAGKGLSVLVPWGVRVRRCEIRDRVASDGCVRFTHPTHHSRDFRFICFYFMFTTQKIRRGGGKKKSRLYGSRWGLGIHQTSKIFQTCRKKSEKSRLCRVSLRLRRESKRHLHIRQIPVHKSLHTDTHQCHPTTSPRPESVVDRTVLAVTCATAMLAARRGVPADPRGLMRAGPEDE